MFQKKLTVMNKEIIDLKSERAEAIEKMNGFVDVCKEEKRVKTEEEQDSFDALNDRVLAIDEEVQELERMEILNKSIKPNKVVKEEEKVAKRYSITKAIEGFSNNKLDGVEKELHDEAARTFGSSNGLLIPDFLLQKRADYTYAGQTTDYDSIVTDLDILASPSLYSQLGATVWSGLKAKTTLNFSDGHDAAFVTEGTTLTESTPTRATAVLDPRRVGGKKGFSNELLSVSKVMSSEISDMIMSIDRAISTEVLSQAVLANIEASHEAADAGAALTWASLMAIGSGLESDNFRNPHYVMSKSIFANAKTIAKDSGSGQFLVDQNAVDGIASFGTTQLPIHDTTKYDVVYGDFSRAYVGFFGDALELLIDPYTDGATGVTNIIFNRLADVVVNPAAFESYRNVIAG